MNMYFALSKTLIVQYFILFNFLKNWFTYDITKLITIIHDMKNKKQQFVQKKLHKNKKKKSIKYIETLLYSLEPWIRLINLLHFRSIHIFKNKLNWSQINVRIVLLQESMYFTFLFFVLFCIKRKMYQKQWKGLVQLKGITSFYYWIY